MLLPSRLRGHVEQHNLLELLSRRSFDMTSVLSLIAVLERWIGWECCGTLMNLTEG